MKKKMRATRLPLGLAACLVVVVAVLSPSVASALSYQYFAGPYPTVDTQAKYQQVFNSAISTNSGGKGLWHSSVGTFKMQTVVANPSQTIVGSAQAGGNTNLAYTHAQTSNTRVQCYWTDTSYIAGSSAIDCARGY